MQTISRWGRFVMLAVCSCAGCGGIAGVDGRINGTSLGDDSASSASSRIVDSTPFPENELWILGSDTSTGRSNLAYVSMSGVGNLLFGLEVTTNLLTGAGCSMQSIIPSGFPIDPNQSTDSDNLLFSFDGRTMSVHAEGFDPASGASCSVDFTATVAQRGSAQVLFGFNAFDVTVQGQPTVNGQPVTLAPLQLNRVRQPKPIACDDPLTSLEGLTWSLSNMNVAATLIPPIPQDVSELIQLDLYGDSDQVYSVDLVTGVDGTYCYGGSGTINFDGRTLVIEAQSEDSGIPGFVEPPTPEPFDFITDNYAAEPLCNNSCMFNRDGECEDGRAGAASGFCAPGTDCSDCGPAEGMDPLCNNSCTFSLDGDCHDGREDVITAICAPGTDCSDCGPADESDLLSEAVFTLESGPSCNDSCAFPRDGECDDGRAGAVTDFCLPGTDCSDCGPVDTAEASPASKARSIASRAPLKNSTPSAISRVVRYLMTASKGGRYATQQDAKLAANQQRRPGESDGTCTFSFTGTVADCGVYLPPILGGFAGATESIRIEGSGRYTTADGQTGEVDTLYLQPDRGTGSGCGLGMIPMLPLMTLALVGFSAQKRRK